MTNSNPIRIILWSALAIVLLAVAFIYGRDLLNPIVPPAPTDTTLPVPTPLAIALVTPLPPAPQVTPVVATPTAFNTPTPEQGGQVLALSPRAGDAGWWASGDTRGNHLGDSFLYAGFFDNQVFVAALRFDLSRVPRGAPLREATLRLTGLQAERFKPDAGGTWSVQLLAADSLPDFARTDFQTLYNAPATVSLFPVLAATDLGVDRVNAWTLDPSGRDWLAKQVVDGKTTIYARILGPNGGSPTLFAWDSGAGPATAGNTPQLLLNLGPPPATPPPLATQDLIVATLQPTPANLLTAAVEAMTATAVASTTGTYTPTPNNIVTPTPTPANLATRQALAALLGEPPLVIPTPVPANAATATADAAWATAVAVITGTFTPVPTNAITPIIIQPTPIPTNLMTAAAQIVAATEQTRRLGTPTPLPYFVLVATVTPVTPEIAVVTSTPRPENGATAAARAAYATAVAVTTGTFTPVPRSWVTPTPLPLVIPISRLSPTPSATPTATPPAGIPGFMRGKILFRSDRSGDPMLFMLDPANGDLSLITQEWPYKMALAKEATSADGRYHVLVQNDTTGVPQITVQDTQYNTLRQITSGDGWSFDPVWSPRTNRIAFVSQNPGNDEIFLVNPDGSDLQRLTNNDWEWDKHPSWSPDGTQIVFWSNRESGRRQLWIMNADGSNQRKLLDSPALDWDPLWVK